MSTHPLKPKPPKYDRAKFKEDWAAKGITIRADYDKPLINMVELKFSPKEWVELLKKDGEYLPACCAIISEIRDTLFNVIRENGMIMTDDLCDLVKLIKDHNSHTVSDEHGHPLKYICDLWEQIKDYVPKERIRKENLNDPKDALGVLANLAQHIDVESMFSPQENTPACRIIDLLQMKAVLATVYHKFSELGPGTHEVWLICNDKGEIPHIKIRYAVYTTEEQAVEMNKQFDRGWVVRHARVSLEKGIELL